MYVCMYMHEFAICVHGYVHLHECNSYTHVFTGIYIYEYIIWVCIHTYVQHIYKSRYAPFSINACIYTCIYIEREREREIQRQVFQPAICVCLSAPLAFGFASRPMSLRWSSKLCISTSGTRTQDHTQYIDDITSRRRSG